MNQFLNNKTFTENELLILDACLKLPGKFPTEELKHIDYWAGEERGILERHGFNIALMSPLCPNFYRACELLIESKQVCDPQLAPNEIHNVLTADENHKVTKAMLIEYCDKLGLTKARKSYGFAFVSYESSKKDLIHILKNSLGATD